MDTGILCLGTRRDAATWERQCKETLGFGAPEPVRHPSPSLDRLKGFFARPAQWLYLGGHFLNRELYNDAHDVSLRFSADRVEVEAGGAKATLRKGTDAFQLDRSLQLILWAGCSTLSDAEFVGQMANLFGSHLAIGFRRMTGPEMCDAMLTGGGFIRQPFFTRTAADPADPATCRAAWMDAALEGYGGGENEDRFGAVDPDGTEWLLRGKSVTRGRKLF